MSQNCDVIIFSIYGQFRAIRKPDSGRIVYNTYIAINFIVIYIVIYFTKTENRTRKSELEKLEKHSTHNIALSKGNIFDKKC